MKCLPYFLVYFVFLKVVCIVDLFFCLYGNGGGDSNSKAPFVVFVPRAPSHIPHWSHSHQYLPTGPSSSCCHCRVPRCGRERGIGGKKRSLGDGVTPRGKLSLTHSHVRTQTNFLGASPSAFPHRTIERRELKALARYIGGWPNFFPRTT